MSLPTDDQVLAMHVCPPGWTEASGYVEMGRITLGDDGRMDPAAVRDKYQSLIHLTPTGSHPSPPMIGYWRGDTFVIVDGRHTFVALVLLGYRTFLVRWRVPPEKRDG